MEALFASRFGPFPYVNFPGGRGGIQALAIVTEDPRFYYTAVRELERREVEFLSLGLDDVIPAGVEVVVTSAAEEKKVRFPTIVAHEEGRQAVVRALRETARPPLPLRERVIGIDPGKSPGIALLLDRKVQEVRRATSPEDVLRVLEEILEAYADWEGGPFLIKVGDGGGIYRRRILKLLQERFRGRVSLVDERETTPAAGEEASPYHRDITAAIHIALREGKALKEIVEVRVSSREIKDLQRRSRILSRDLTISRGLAERVAKGELTLEEAVEEQRERRPSGSEAPSTPPNSS
jgi:hypothetical protein